MKDKLTLSVDSKLIEKAKSLAKKQNTTLSRQFEKMVEEWEINFLKDNDPQHPLVRAIFGRQVAIGKNADELKEEFYGNAGKAEKK